VHQGGFYYPDISRCTVNRTQNVQTLIKKSPTIRYHNKYELNEDPGNLSE